MYNILIVSEKLNPAPEGGGGPLTPNRGGTRRRAQKSYRLQYMCNDNLPAATQETH